MTSPTSQPEIFWISGSPYSWRVLLTLEIKQIPYVSRLLQASKGELKAPEYLALNPRGRVPTLKDENLVVCESLAIMSYLERRYPEPALFGRTAREAALIWQRISEYVSYLDGPLGRIVRPLYFGKAAEQADDIRAAIPPVHGELERLQAALDGAPWLSGESIGAADVAIYPFIKSLLRASAKDAAAPFEFGWRPLGTRYPKFAAWMQGVEAVPGYERAYPPHWRETVAAA